MLKFQRNYYAKLERGSVDGYTYLPEEEIIIQYPYTCEFEILLGIDKASNNAMFQFYNLPPDIQAKLWKDNGDNSRYVSIEFYAGYEDNMPLLFKGNFIFCNTQKPSGSTDFITLAQAAIDARIWNDTYVNYTFFKGTDLLNIVDTLLSENSTVFTGYITPKIPPLSRNKTYLGQPLDLLQREYSGYKIFIDAEERLNILDENEVIPGDIQVITAESGLLGSPRRADTLVELTTIFEPGLRPGQAIQVIDNLVPYMNQYYQILTLQHKGTISGAICGQAVTILTLNMLGGNFEILKNRSDLGYTGQQTTGQWLKPVQGVVSSPFGYRVRPTANASENHQGMDIACTVGSDIICPANGKVVYAGSFGGYGYYMRIDHGIINGNRVTSAYGHLSQWLVSQQQSVSAGQIIAKSGGAPGQPGAGVSTGSHLHFEVRENNVAVNPTKYIGNY